MINSLKQRKINFAQSNVSCSSYSLEEKQRAEKRAREAKGQEFSPRWFEITEEVAPTPWGDLEIYQYNGKYSEHRAAIDNSGTSEDVDISTTEFNPWQYGNVAETEQKSWIRGISCGGSLT